MKYDKKLTGKDLKAQLDLVKDEGEYAELFSNGAKFEFREYAGDAHTTFLWVTDDFTDTSKNF